MEWSAKQVVVTGLAHSSWRNCRSVAVQNAIVPRSKAYDLRDRDAIIRLYKETRPHIVLHLAAVVGGIDVNRANPGRFFYDNAIMGIQLMEYARQFGVEKFVAIGTVCAYPKLTPVPFKEDDLWNSYPEKTNAPMGWRKR